MNVLYFIVGTLIANGIETGVTLGIHFLVGWPVWLSLVIAHVIVALRSWIIAPPTESILFFFNFVLISFFQELLMIYIPVVMVLRLIGHPSW
jgi:hypothetical protein